MSRKRFSFSTTFKAAAVCAILFLALLLCALMSNILRHGELTAKERALKAEIASLAEEKARNQEILGEMYSAEAADAYARQQLDLKKKGETLYKGEEPDSEAAAD